jgi:hypothetical protein
MPKAIPNPQPNGQHAGPANGHPKPGGSPESGHAVADPSGTSLGEMDSRWNTGLPFGGQNESGQGSLESVFQGGDAPDPAEMERLVAENGQLREIIAELRHAVDHAAGKREQSWQEQQKEYEGLLEEKSELIRNLHAKVQELEAQKPVAPLTPKEEELLALNEELERERCRIEQERRQLDEDLKQFKDDEQIMVQQMRDMELQMARERAELARQRNDLQRILDEIRHEIERVERDGGLNERLVMLRQRYHDVSKGRIGPPQTSSAPDAAPAAAPKDEKPRDNSGFFSRLFG